MVHESLPEPDYPEANPSRRQAPVRFAEYRRPVMPQYPTNQGGYPGPGYAHQGGYPMAQTGFPGQGFGPTYSPGGGQGPIPYPAGRGPGVCPNFAVQDQCECHQWEARQRQNRNFYPDRSRSESNIARMRRSESMLGRGGF
jgi:hypothetical protein